jgi:hypothetical protein
MAPVKIAATDTAVASVAITIFHVVLKPVSLSLEEFDDPCSRKKK